MILVDRAGFDYMQRNVLKNLIKPKKVDCEVSDSKYAKFVIEPLERGYGTTLGNALRRVMLSSMPGVAITSVSIEGVSHEFGAIPGCIEDVTEIILNLKEVVLDLGDKDSATLRIEAKGPCNVTAGMIVGEGGAVSVIDPSTHICTLNEDGKFVAELTARVGRGYVNADDIKRDDDLPVSAIAIDAIFSPVRKVRFVTSNARVGQRTDHDKLVVEIWTDGSVRPESAIEGAAYILSDQLAVFIQSVPVTETVDERVSENKPRFNDNLFRRVDELELSVRSSNCLEAANIKYIGELVRRSEAEMLRTKNFGRKSLNEIKEILGEMGLSLGMTLDGFPSREDLERMSAEQGRIFSKI